jgi:ribosome biogenesis GTPase
MPEGVIIKALSGFYYVQTPEKIVTCRGRGKLRHEGVSPLVGDRVEFSGGDGVEGSIERVLPRKNSFYRPAVANIDCMVLLASAVNPVTDPFLLDRMTVYAEKNGCDCVICINKADIDPAQTLYDIYKTTGYSVLRTSAVTGQGIGELRAAIAGRVCVFTGNSGVGKSSLLNALSPDLSIPTGLVSEKLGRGRHTTRHVELFSLGDDAFVADTPGFSSFDLERTEAIEPRELDGCFREFAPFLGKCRFDDCAHIAEPDCEVLKALEAGAVSESRYASYARLYIGN